MKIKKVIANSFFLLDYFFIALIKSKRLLNLHLLVNFFKSWHRIGRHNKKIIIYLQKNSF